MSPGSDLQNNILPLVISFLEGLSESPTAHVFIRISGANIFRGEAIGLNRHLALKYS